jgi:HK97 family phage portal protein
MNLLARIKAAFTSEKVRASSVSVVGAAGQELRQPFSYDAAVRRYSSWVYAAANLNAIAVASTPLRLYVRNRSAGTKVFRTRRVDRRAKAYLAGDSAYAPSRQVVRKVAEFASDFEVVEDSHPILELLSRANPYQNGFDATVLRVLYGELTGNAYLHPIIDERLGIPVELWTLPSQNVEIVPGKERFIDGYLYGATRQNRTLFTPEEIIHFRRPSPSNMYYGAGKLEAAWGVVLQNEEIHAMDLHFFANKARPDWLLTVKGDAHPDELERLEAQIDEKLRGSKRSGRFISATAEIDIKPLQFPPKDLAGRDEVVEEIAAVFGVPVSMLKANDPNLASARQGFQTWRESTILPLLRMDEEALNQSLVPLFGIEGDAFLAYDNPVPEDEQFQLTRRTALVAGGILTINEARAEEGLEPAEEPLADEPLVNGQPLGTIAQSATPLSMPIESPVEPTQTTEPSGTPDSAEAIPQDVEAVADTALNGAQISSLVDLAKSVQLGELPLETAKAIAGAAFPTIDPAVIQSIFDPIEPSAPSEPIATDRILSDTAAIETKPERQEGETLEDIDTRPPQAVADNARRALEVRAEKPESQRGMTEVGIARARDLANRENLSEDTIRRMLAYFERHEVDKQGETWDEQGPGWQAWHGWGGDEGFAWARRKVDEFDRARGEKRAKPCGCCAGAKRKSASALWTKASREDAEREFDEITEREKLVARGVSEVLAAQVAAVVREIRKAERPTAELVAKVERLIRSNRWDAALVDSLRPFIADALEAGVSLGLETVARVEGAPTFTPNKDDLAAYTQAESTRLARVAGSSVNGYTSVRVRDLLEDGIEKGETIDDLADRVQDWAGEKGDADRLVRNRALMVARTEAQRATRAAEVEAWKATGVVEGKAWLLAPDPCEFCEAASKAFSKNAVGLGESFYAKGSTLVGADGGEMVLDYEDIQGPPLHPNCRCSLQPRLRDDLEEIATDIERELGIG